MRRALTAAGAGLLLALWLSGCGDDAAKSSSPNDEPSASPSESVTPLPSEATPDVPELSTGPPTPAPAGSFDGCAIVSPELIEADFGADAGQSMSQASSLGDPGAGDCIYFGGDATIVVQATTRADQDLPESTSSYQGLPGAEAVPGADRGWAYVFPNQSGTSVTSGLILVRGQLGLQCSITIDGHPYDNETLQAFAQHVLAEMG